MRVHDYMPVVILYRGSEKVQGGLELCEEFAKDPFTTEIRVLLAEGDLRVSPNLIRHTAATNTVLRMQIAQMILDNTPKTEKVFASLKTLTGMVARYQDYI